MWLFYGIAGITWIFAHFVKRKLLSAYRKWGRIRNSSDSTGAQAAHAVLVANDMRQVRLVPAPGELSDHYDSRSKTIRLSETVYGVPSVAAVAIAAHETGHATQDAVGCCAGRRRFHPRRDSRFPDEISHDRITHTRERDARARAQRNPTY